jgi:hypothetical protein
MSIISPSGQIPAERDLSIAPESLLTDRVSVVFTTLLGKSPAETLLLALGFQNEAFDVETVHRRLHSLLGRGAGFLERAILADLSQTISANFAPPSGVPSGVGTLLEDARVCFGGGSGG